MINNKLDKKVLYYSIFCTAIRVLLGSAKTYLPSVDVRVFPSLQLAVGIFFIFLIYLEYKKDEKYKGRYYTLYLLGAFFLLIIINSLKLFTIDYFKDAPLNTLLLVSSTFNVVWVFVNAFLFQFFKRASHNV